MDQQRLSPAAVIFICVTGTVLPPLRATMVAGTTSPSRTIAASSCLEKPLASNNACGCPRGPASAIMVSARRLAAHRHCDLH
jgi:hypothetical protein